MIRRQLPGRSAADDLEFHVHVFPACSMQSSPPLCVISLCNSAGALRAHIQFELACGARILTPLPPTMVPTFSVVRGVPGSGIAVS